MQSSVEFEQLQIAIPSGDVAYIVAGRGKPVVYLHHSWGSPGALPFHHNLVALGLRTIVPDLPGWGGSHRPAWARDVRDIAILVGCVIDALKLGPVTLIGSGFGGYIATELATMSPSRMSSLILIGAVGLYPEEGEILDQMMLSHRQYIQESFRDLQTYIDHFGEEPEPEIRTLWDLSREMTARVSWKPYMHNRRLKHLLPGVSCPVLIVQGESDKVVPCSVATQSESLLPNSRLEVVPNAGHLVEFEEPKLVSDLVHDHIRNL
ncbi:MAG: alpha/beta hydrolase [Gammaproteobacteria bacterium]|nr:alpha/beta hydrolase [Gammaproteobacteria bacterium]